jgi:hypothetical protein
LPIANICAQADADEGDKTGSHESLMDLISDYGKPPTSKKKAAGGGKKDANKTEKAHGKK